MSEKCRDISKLQNLDEASDQYAELVDHLDSCTFCQSQLDTDFASNNTAELIHQIQQSGVVGDEDFESEYATATPQHPESATRFLEPPSHPELLGRLGRYDIERVVGQGGMGVVFKAMDTELHRIVAVKALAEHLATSAPARLRFAREAQAAAAVLHPNVIPIYNVEPNADSPYLVMQYVEGESLQRRVDRTGPLGIVDALRIAKQTSEALAAAHDQGLVHRDVKPSNILLEEQTDRAVLSDFGLARSADDASLTQTGIVAGTPHYMSPEQAKGHEITYASDIFALGSVLYFVLSGRPPFRAESAMGVLNCICTEPHRSIGQINSDVPLELKRLVDRCLAKKPSKRPASAKQVAAELEDILSRIQQGKIRLDQPSQFSRLFIPVALVAAICLALGLSLFYPRGSIEGENASPESTPAALSPPTNSAVDGKGKPQLSAELRDMIASELEKRTRLEQELGELNQALEMNSSIPSAIETLPNGDVWDNQIEEINASLRSIETHLDQYNTIEKRSNK
ncbi:MAG: serine/threonine-protein kinase [Aureliella sp.]